MSISGVTGYSKLVQPASETPTVYAGITGSCTDTTQVCDTCTGVDKGSSFLWPCSKVNVSPAMLLVIRAVYTGNVSSTSPFSLKVDSETVSGVTFVLEGSNVVVAAVPWSSLCAQFDSGGRSDCSSGAFEKTLTIAADGSGGSTSESTTLKIVARGISVGTTSGTDWFYTACPEGTPGNYGWCYAEAFRGDSKVYTDSMAYASGYPATGESGVDFDSVVFFYEVGTTGETDASILARISNKSPSKTVTVDTSATPISLNDNSITGLTNGSRVCFKFGNQDETGIISYFTPDDDAGMCATPTEVAGLLDGQECFIATAAYGSPMAPQVEWIRKFRNEYLLRHAWGQKFVKFYYQHSPPVAHWIAQHEWARASVRAVLWPVLAFSWLSVNFGLLWALVLSGVFTLAVVELCVALQKRRKTRSEA